MFETVSSLLKYDHRLADAAPVAVSAGTPVRAEIVDIIIGNRSQFAQATPMSARIAAETSFGFDLHMDTAMVAMDVVLRIANITGAPSDFRATIAGTTAIP